MPYSLAENKKDWDIYVQLDTYACNMQKHITIGTIKLNFIIPCKQLAAANINWLNGTPYKTTYVLLQRQENKYGKG